MTAEQIIQEIKRLPAKEQASIIRAIYRFDAERKLSGAELSQLAERMANATDEVEAARIREDIVNGFYGRNTDA
jgi:hypothetical protein